MLRALLIVLGLSVTGIAVPPGRARASQPRAYEPHEVIVGYAAHGAGRVAVAAAARMGLHRAAPAPAARQAVLRLPHGETVAVALRRLRRTHGVAYAQPDYIARTAGAFYPDDGGTAGGAHGWEKTQWNLLPGAGVDAPRAWANLLADHHPGGRGATVAILDTGVAYRNYKQFHQSPDFDQTRFVSPYDFVSDNAYPLDREGHGTFVAGVVAESTNNKIGLTGLAYGASIMPIRVLDSRGEGDESTIARGIRYAANHHADVINLSLEFLPSAVNSGSEIPEIVSAINFALRRGVVVIGAAGNDEDNQIAYPARVPGVVSVGATTKDRCLADYSNAGKGLDLVAPGGGDDSIITQDNNCHPERSLPSIFQETLTSPPHWDRFGFPNYYIGTSMASPEVAAAAELVIASRVLGRHPSPEQVLARLEQTATPLGGPAPNDIYGYGLLNVGAATANANQR